MHIIEPNYFTTPMLTLSWSLVVQYYVNQGSQISLDTLSMLLQKSGKYRQEDINAFKESVSSADLRDVDVVVNEVTNFCKESAFLMTISKSVDDITKGNFDKVYVKMQELFERNFDQPDMGLDYYKDINRRYLGGDDLTRDGAVPTGLPIDQYWGGGLGRKELGAVFGPTNRGKTAMLLNIAHGAIRAGENVLYVSCELSENALAKRMDSIMMSNLRAVETFFPGDLITALRQVQKEKYGEFFIKEFGSGELTVPQLYSFVRGFEAQKKMKFGVVIVDYLGEMCLPKAEREDIRYKDLTTTLRGLAKKLETRIWTAHQTKQGSHRKTLLLEDDISDSSGILKVVDVAFTLSATHLEWVAGYTRLTVIKNRFGPTAMTEVVKFNGACQRFLPADITEMQEAVDRKADELEVSIMGGQMRE
jgi:KaiC/GvpD/RAD55 family RecA-like ATPase